MNQDTTRYSIALLLVATLAVCGFAKDGAMHGERQPPLEKADFGVFTADDAIGLFLLVGQSNMKGRGAIDMMPATDKKILFFHPKQQAWFVARDPLHATGTPDRLDPRDNAGTGPGLSFAKALVGKGQMWESD